MNSQKIIYENKEFFVSQNGLTNDSISKICLYEDIDLSVESKNISGNRKIVKKSSIRVINEGGAGYAVYGGGGGNYGNPGGGGIGQNQGTGGGPNIMYTYGIKPLNKDLEQEGTNQGNNKTIHVGTEIEGRIFGAKDKIVAKVLRIEKDETQNILAYTVLDKDGIEQKMDPTSAVIMTHEQGINMDLMGRDMVVGENFYPRFDEFLNEESVDEGIKDKITKGLATLALAGTLAASPKTAKASDKKVDPIEMSSEKKIDNVTTIKATGNSKDQSIAGKKAKSNASRKFLEQKKISGANISGKIINKKTFKQKDGSYTVEIEIQITKL